MKIFNHIIESDFLKSIQNMPIKCIGHFDIDLTNPPPVDKIDIAQDATYIEIDRITKANIFNKLCLTDIRLTNIIAYPPNGGMDWHTNGNDAGNRLYVSWSDNGNSGMCWYRENKIVVDQDHKGWNIRYFSVPEWHKVWSKCYRLSFGFQPTN